MPAPSAAFAYLAQIVTRHPHGRVPCSVVISGTRYDVDPAGLPLGGYFFEQDSEDTVEDALVMVSVPVISLAVADLPSIPQRGDSVIFDDGTYGVVVPKLRGAQVELTLSKPQPTRAGRRRLRP